MIREIKLHERFPQKGDINSHVFLQHLLLPFFILIEQANDCIFVEKIFTFEGKDSSLISYAEENVLAVPFPPANT